MRVIAPDRPGYGLSDFKKKRTIADWTDDVVELADALGLGRFAVAGISGGGPYAAAAALRISDRLTFAAIISGVGPFEAAGATEGMSRMNRILFGAARRVPPVSRAILESMSFVGRSHPERAINQMLKSVPEADRAVLSDENIRQLLHGRLQGGVPAGRARRRPRNGPVRAAVGLPARGHRHAGDALAGRGRRQRAAFDGPLPGAGHPELRCALLPRARATCSSSRTCAR